MRLLCDRMLLGLGRWLRAAGHDTARAGDDEPDRDLVARACREERLLLTRDRKLLEIRGAAPRTLRLRSNRLDGQARELRRRLDLDWLHRPLSRCLRCNEATRPASPEEADRLPPGAAAQLEALAAERRGPWVCPACDRLYWRGGHAERMLARLEVWARDAG